MKTKIKNLISSKVFWIVLGLGIFLWLFKGFFSYDIYDIEGLFLFKSGYLIFLLIPMVFFYLSVRNKFFVYYILSLGFLILWGFFAYFYFMWINFFGWGIGCGPSSIKDFDFITLFILIHLLSFFIISSAYIIFCRYLKKYSQVKRYKRKNLWSAWIGGLLVMFLLTCLYVIKKHIIFADGTQTLGLKYELKYLFFPELIAFTLQWIILTLPPTLKMDNILFKESQI